MTDRHDPHITALIVELVESSPEAPRFDELEALAAGSVGEESVRLLETVEPRRRHAWTVGIAATAVVLILGGVLAWLAPFGGQAPPASENSPPTTVAVTPTTVPVVPPGEGPKLSFVQAEAPTDREFDSGEWFNGALYVLSSSDGTQGTRELFRTRDGFTWELIPGFPGATNVEDSMLQTDGNLLVNVVMLSDYNRDIQSDAFIQVNTSTNGTDWISSSIERPVPPIGSNMAGEFDLDDPVSDDFAVGPKGIVVTAAFNLGFEVEGFANSLVDPDEGIHVEVVDLDLDRGVMIVRYLDEDNDLEQIGDLREIDLNEAGFSDAFSNLLDAMAADPDWNPLVPGFVARLSDGTLKYRGSASVGYAWFSSDGVTWQRVPNASRATTPTVPFVGASFVDSAGPLDGGQFSAILATPDGFVATASSPSLGFDSSVVWQSADGMTWTEATGLTSGHGLDESRLVEWKGELVEHVSVSTGNSPEDFIEVRTLGLPRRQVFSDMPIGALVLDFSEFGLIGTPKNDTWGRDRTLLLFSVDGTSWNRWEPAEFPATGEDAGGVWVVGVGKDFVVIQLRDLDESSGSTSYSLWVGVVP